MPYKGYIFDLDGTIYLGESMIPGADTAIRALRESGRKVVFLSNKPIASPDDYAQKLTSLGLPTAAGDVINSSQVAAEYLTATAPKARIHLIGEPPLWDVLVNAGMRPAIEPEETDLVLISLDRALSYEKIHFAYRAARAGARVLATNPDLICPVEDGEIIDAGATIAALEALLGRPIDGVIGKPSPIMIEYVVSRMGCHPAACLMVGDRLETDIAMGKAAGMASALVLTGVTDRETVARSQIQPDFILASIADLHPDT